MENPHEPLKDVQNSPDARKIPIEKVGVRNVRYPIALRGRDGALQHTVGVFALTVDLPHKFKGTHMSRFLEVLGEETPEIGVESIPTILEKLRSRLNAAVSHLEARFTFFLPKSAPVTRKRGMMGYDCAFIATRGEEEDFVMEVKAPVTTLCPCSREIASRGAHNQRGLVTARVRFDGAVWIEDLIEAIEACASCELYPVLKRPDEKFVTEKAYDNPRFVEDMVRELALRFDQDDRIRSYEIEVENEESIHAHNAYAYVARSR